eukprot:6468184-Amphidinium_carterae.1
MLAALESGAAAGRALADAMAGTQAGGGTAAWPGRGLRCGGGGGASGGDLWDASRDANRRSPRATTAA